MHNIHSVVQVVLCDKLVTSSLNSMRVRVQNYMYQYVISVTNGERNSYY